MSNTIPIKEITILEIKCSICRTNLREDKEVDEHGYGNQRYHFSQKALRERWCFGSTSEGFVLTFCPDHSALADDLMVTR
jgi:hypothetical protein